MQITQDLNYPIKTINDYDITGFYGCYRASVPVNIKKGDIFNIRFFPETKYGATWTGTLEASLLAWIKEYPEAKTLCNENPTKLI